MILVRGMSELIHTVQLCLYGRDFNDSPVTLDPC